MLKRIDDYPAYLASCWLEHLAEREANAPTVISTFAGAGGSSLGYSMAGYKELLAVEWDDNAVQTFKLNFADVPVYHGDIAKLSVEQCLEMAKIQPGELDVFDGSPPCQGFSTAGKRMIDDPRNSLFREYVRLLQGLKPKVFVMENVSGMVKGKMKLVFVEILKELKASGYKVSARLLNAMYFGVPQSRQRMIFIGVRDDLGIEPSHPVAETQAVTVGQAWKSIENERGDELKGPALEIASSVPPGGNNGGGKYSKVIRGTLSGFGFSRLSFDKPSCTIPKLSLLSSSPIVHPLYNCRISIHQCKRIASFDDNFEMAGDFTQQWARIGNSVPPLFMRSIARHIRTNVLEAI